MAHAIEFKGVVAKSLEPLIVTPDLQARRLRKCLVQTIQRFTINRGEEITAVSDVGLLY